MPNHSVNLDALIPREDLQVDGPNPERPGGDVPQISLNELQLGRSMFEVLRKPDFQRETAEWTPSQIVELVKNTLDEELIPAVIVWKAPNRDVFVIDGAHRLSALIAWINDDYGSGFISQKFFGLDKIPSAQIAAAKKVKALIESEIGSFHELSKFRNGGGTQEQTRRAKALATAYVVVQSVRNDASHAEASFYRINQGGARIDQTEKEIIHARRRPQALATRALLRAGSGHQYWWEFEESVKKEIVDLSNSLHATLFQPDVGDTFRTLDLPMAGKGYSTTSLNVLYEFIHIANHLHRPETKQASPTKLEPLPMDDPEKDINGAKTIAYLKEAKRIAELVTSKSSGSLGLHPAVYCYTATGKFQAAGFFAQVQFVQYLEKMAAFQKFTYARQRMEEFLVFYKYFFNQLIGKVGSGTRSLKTLLELYIFLYERFSENKSIIEVKDLVLKTAPFAARLKEVPEAGASTTQPRFARETKAAIRLNAALSAAPRCLICHARYHENAVSIDHVKTVRAGGIGSMTNGAVTHPYCNTGFKNWAESNHHPFPLKDGN